MEQGFIEEYPLMSRFPKRPDLLFLPLRRKDLLLHTQRDKVLQAFSFGIVEASLPLPHGAPGDPSRAARPACVRPMLVRSLNMTCPKV